MDLWSENFKEMIEKIQWGVPFTFISRFQCFVTSQIHQSRKRHDQLRQKYKKETQRSTVEIATLGSEKTMQECDIKQNMGMDFYS